MEISCVLFGDKVVKVIVYCCFLLILQSQLSLLFNIVRYLCVRTVISQWSLV